MRGIGYLACTLLLGLGWASGCLGELKGAETCVQEGHIVDDDPADCKQMVCTDGKLLEGPALPDDGNPCTDDTCDGDVPQHDATNGGSCTLGASSGTCMQGTCVIGCVSSAACDDDNPCTTDVCNQATQCEYTPDDSLQLDDGNPCTAESCNGGQAEIAPLAAGTPCATGQCDGMGSCKKANGQSCAASSDCASGFCVDGYCCNNGCGATCASCNLPDKEGTCTLVPPGEEDSGLNSCTGTMACDGGGSCLKKTGQPCLNSSECLSDYCSGTPKVCK